MGAPVTEVNSDASGNKPKKTRGEVDLDAVDKKKKEVVVKAIPVDTIPTATVRKHTSIPPLANVVSRAPTDSHPLAGETSHLPQAVPVKKEKPIEFVPHTDGADDVVDVMIDVADKISKMGKRSELTDENRQLREQAREALAEYIKGNQVDIKTLKAPITYAGEKMSILELAAKLNLGPKVAEAILDKAELAKQMFTQEEIQNAHDNIHKHRDAEQLANGMNAASEIAGFTATGFTTGAFGGGPGGAILGTSLGLSAGVATVATTEFGETPAKDTEKLLRKYIQKPKKTAKTSEKPVTPQVRPIADIEMQPLPMGKRRNSEGHSH